jgi:DNA polymerase-4
MRIIAHVDMDAFFASVEQRDDPALQGKAVIVGGTGTRGVVSTCSYEARKYGVHSAMPMAKARRLCPGGIFLSGRMELYREVSQEIFAVLLGFTPLVEVASIDEAFLDLTGATHFYSSLVELGEEIQRRIYQRVALTASVGIAPNKFLAKLASDWEKPSGLTIIKEDEVEDFLNPLPVEKLWGVGPATIAKLHKYGFTTAGDLARAPLGELVALFGRSGKTFWGLAQGHDPRPVEIEREAKSMGQEETFPTDLQREEARSSLAQLAAKVGSRLRAEGLGASTITLKARYNDFETVTRSLTLPSPTWDDDLIFKTAWELLEQLPAGKKYRLLGVTASRLSASRQLSLFKNPKGDELLSTMDRLREKYGTGVIVRGRELGGRTKCD